MGWVSFGIARSGYRSLENSDLFIAWITNNGAKTIFIDAHFEGNYTIMPDTEQNWQLLSSSESNGITCIKFTRKIILSDIDSENDVDIETGTPNVTYAWGTVDPVSFINYHTSRRGMRPVPLLTGVKQTPFDDPSSLSYLYFMANNISIPSDKSDFFYCSKFSAPRNTTKKAYQIIRVDLN